MKHITATFLLLMLLFFSCAEGPATPVDVPLVVEGYIENDGYPVVMVTKSLPVTTSINLNHLEDYLVKWAKVSVINGKDTVVLTGKYDKGYFPPYIYTTGRMRGKVGETYQLIVENDGTILRATTTIPTAPEVKGYVVEKCQDSDTLYQITAHLKNDDKKQSYYQFFSRVGSANKQFLVSFLGGYDGSIVSGDLEVPVYRGHRSMMRDYTPYFSVNDTVAVKCCHLDDYEYDFWRAYIETQYLTGGALTPTTTNLPSNIEGGTGYWFGYGSETSYFVIKDYAKGK